MALPKELDIDFNKMTISLFFRYYIVPLPGTIIFICITFCYLKFDAFLFDLIYFKHNYGAKIPILQTLSTPKHFVNRPHSFHFQIEIENDQRS